MQYLIAALAGCLVYFVVIPLVVSWWTREPRGTRISCRVIADSINPNGDRITTLEGVFNRYLLAEFNTHRILSRNSASSRAIPVHKVLWQVLTDPAMPIHWGANQAGMQARAQLGPVRQTIAKKLFLWARFPAIVIVWLLTRVGLHKQVANRLLEPWVWHTVVFTATDFRNFLKLRLHPDAQPEFQEFARCVKAAIDASTPRKLQWGEWHLPYIDIHDDSLYPMNAADEALGIPAIARVSCARCARVSYVRQNEKRDIWADYEMSQKLSSSGHWSPFEHVAQAMAVSMGNFQGWKQLRKFFPGEDGTNG